MDEKTEEQYCNIFVNEVLMPRLTFLQSIGEKRHDIALSAIPIYSQILFENAMITDIESATFGSQNAYKYHINIVNYSLIGLKYVKINGINLFKKKNTRNFAAAH